MIAPLGRRAVQPLAGNGLAGSVAGPAASADESATTVGDSTVRSVTERICSEPGTSPSCIWPDGALLAAGVGVFLGPGMGMGDATTCDPPDRIDPARGPLSEHDPQPRP